MKAVSLAAAALLVVSGVCRAQGSEATENESVWRQATRAATEEEIQALGIERAVVDRLSARTGAQPEAFHVGSDKEGAPSGVSWSADATRADEIVASEREELRKHGLVAFLSERRFGVEPDRIAIIRSADPLAPVTLQGTSGKKLEISNAEIVQTLREWQAAVRFELLGAGSDWVEIELRQLPSDFDAFVSKVRELAPDSLGRDAESLERLREEIRRTRRVYLWWDED